MNPRDIDRVRQAYYERLASGEEKPPVHEFNLPGNVAPPTPKQKHLAEISKAGIVPVADPLLKSTDPDAVADKTQTSRGALVDEDPVDPHAPSDPSDPADPDDDAVDPPEPPEDPSQVEIPEDYASLPWNNIRALARNFTKDVVTNKEHAASIIAAEVQRRQEAGE